MAIAGSGMDIARCDPTKPENAKKVGIVGYDWGSKPDDVKDGLSNTLMIGEHPASQQDGGWALGDWGWWYTTVNENIGTYWNDDVVYGIAAQSSHFGSSPTQGACPTNNFYRVPYKRPTVCNYDTFWSYHINGASFILGDGSVRFIPYSARPVMEAMATRAKGDSFEGVP